MRHRAPFTAKLYKSVTMNSYLFFYLEFVHEQFIFILVNYVNSHFYGRSETTGVILIDSSC